jgi:hypothetical protein
MVRIYFVLLDMQIQLQLVNAIDFKFDTGNIDDGIIKMYGVAKS